jgi:hypothetical protein
MPKRSGVLPPIPPIPSLKPGAEPVKKALGLIGAVALAGDDEPLEREEGQLLLRLAVEKISGG